MTRYKLIDGIRIECTAEEVAELDAMKADWDSKAFDRAIAALRFKRNNLLAETDWMANSDVTISDDWKTYRQQLRDLPSGLDTVEKVEAKEFPKKPGA
tara:strand:- start:133 stop:426 length:294 start_codon:yes stop_codon:yes gene_type:complete